jgi:hypothetical protein
MPTTQSFDWSSLSNADTDRFAIMDGTPLGYDAISRPFSQGALAESRDPVLWDETPLA